MTRRADHFEIVSEWHLDAPVERVWQALVEVESWPRWWPYVREVRTLRAGDAGSGGELGAVRRLRWASLLPYGIDLDVETVEQRPHARLRGRASGDLRGSGLWELERDGAGTRVRYTWQVELATRWMRLAAPLMAPVFRWNHEGVMRAGERGLAAWLARPSPDPAAA